MPNQNKIEVCKVSFSQGHRCLQRRTKFQFRKLGFKSPCAIAHRRDCARHSYLVEQDMSNMGDSISEFFADSLALAFGWAFCLTLLVGFYGLGYWLAPYFAGDEHRSSVATLSAIVLIWLYEHRRADARWDRLDERMSKLSEQITEGPAHF
jgi:hypothetical protein